MKLLPHYVIVGNSAAAVAAAEALRRVTSSADVTMIADEPLPPYSRCLLPEAVARKLSVEEIAFRPGDFYHRLNIQPLLGKRVEAVDPEARRIRLEGGREIPYTALLVATGARPVRPALPGGELEGVFTLRTWRDAQGIAARAEAAAQAVVVGGGLVGLKAATALKKRGVPEVTVVVKSARLLSRQLDARGAALVQDALKEQGIKFVFGREPRAFEAKAGRDEVGTVVLEDGERLEADLVLVGKGVVPNAELVRAAGGLVRRGVVVNGHQQTSLPGVYAAGDVTETTDLLTGEAVPSGLWTLAVEQGRIAGLNMAGERCQYEGGLTRLNAAEFAGVPFVSVGLVDYKGADGQCLSYFDPHKGCYRSLVFKGEKLLGAILVGDIAGAGIYTALIRRGLRVIDQAEALLRGEMSAYRFLNLARELPWPDRAGNFVMGRV